MTHLARFGCLLCVVMLLACTPEPTIRAEEAPFCEPRDVVAETGAALFVEYGCTTCHGLGGRGDGPAAHATAVRPRDLADRASYRQGSSAAAISRTIAEGLPNAGAGMPAFAHIPQTDRDAIATFVESLHRKEESQ